MKRSRAFSGQNLEEDQREAHRLQSINSDTLNSISNSQVDIQDTPQSDIPNKIRFDQKRLKDYIKRWIQEKPHFAFNGIEKLKNAAENGELRAGQLIFQVSFLFATQGDNEINDRSFHPMFFLGSARSSTFRDIRR